MDSKNMILLLFICIICFSNAAYVKKYRIFEEIKFINHVGVQVMLDDNRYVVVHNPGKGNKYKGTMADWKKTINCGKKVICGPWKPALRKVTVEDLVVAGGKGYNLFTNNCHSARKRILKALTGSQ